MKKMKKIVSLFAVFIIGSWSMINAASSDPLRVLAKKMRDLGREFYIGCAIRSNFDGSDESIARTEFDILTAENDMKIGTISPSSYQTNYSGGDRLVSFASANNMVVHGHAFIWHKYLPGWVDGSKNTMVSYINKVSTHFRKKIYAWDVVNEAFHRDGSYRINAIGGGGQDGGSIWGQHQTKQYIEDAFRAAHSADPYAKLLYNDYAIETNDAKFNGMLQMLREFTDRGVPIDGVGFQVHLNYDFTEADARGFAEKMQKVADLGLESYVTEMDVGCSSTSSSGLEQQADIYYWVTKACVEQPMCRALQVWGIKDYQSWRINPDDPVDRATAPLIFNDGGGKKPAYYAIQRAMDEAVEALSSTPDPTPTPTPERLLGDVDGDDVIDITDALMVAQHYVGRTPSGFIAANADVNDDGLITLVDALMIAQYYVRRITEF